MANEEEITIEFLLGIFKFSRYIRSVLPAAARSDIGDLKAQIELRRLGGGLISSEPRSSRCRQNSGEEVSSEFVEARSNAAEVFDFAEEALDHVALAIKARVDRLHAGERE